MTTVDISFTVKASERKGRRLLRNVETGEEFYEGDALPAADLVSTVTEGVATHARKKTRAKKSTEGDR